jgi:hypothetical protein
VHNILVNSAVQNANTHKTERFTTENRVKLTKLYTSTMSNLRSINKVLHSTGGCLEDISSCTCTTLRERSFGDPFEISKVTCRIQLHIVSPRVATVLLLLNGTITYGSDSMSRILYSCFLLLHLSKLVNTCNSRGNGPHIQ